MKIFCYLDATTLRGFSFSIVQMSSRKKYNQQAVMTHKAQDQLKMKKKASQS